MAPTDSDDDPTRALDDFVLRMRQTTSPPAAAPDLDDLADLGARLHTGPATAKPSGGANTVFIFISFNQIILIAFLMVTRRAMENAQEIKVKTEKLQKDKIRAQFNALKNQVNPHFLFNSLSTLSTLVHADPDLSEKFIEQLSKAYRYILEQRDKELVTLATELEFIRAYLFLLDVRYKGKLCVRIDIPETLKNHCQVPPLALQMLVEHTVMHNRMSAKDPLHIHIGASDGDALDIRHTRQPRPHADWAEEDNLQELIHRYALVTTEPIDIRENDQETIIRVPLLHTEIPPSIVP